MSKHLFDHKKFMRNLIAWERYNLDHVEFKNLIDSEIRRSVKAVLDALLHEVIADENDSVSVTKCLKKIAQIKKDRGIE